MPSLLLRQRWPRYDLFCVFAQFFMDPTSRRIWRNRLTVALSDISEARIFQGSQLQPQSPLNQYCLTIGKQAHEHSKSFVRLVSLRHITHGA